MKGYHYRPICLKTQEWEGVEFEEEEVYKMSRWVRERIQLSLRGQLRVSVRPIGNRKLNQTLCKCSRLSDSISLLQL